MQQTDNRSNTFSCRFCGKPLTRTFIDLGMSPIANDYVPFEKHCAMEPFYPLHVFICDSCLLVQLPNIKREDEIFTDEYAYFSSYSTSWLAHAKEYVESMISRFPITDQSLVIELASNDGYLLQYFKEKNIPVLGVEPTANTARVAMQKGIETIVKFFGVDTAEEMKAQGKTAN
ncbi:SAM-dependent methyltransferase, partial [bacterium]